MGTIPQKGTNAIHNHAKPVAPSGGLFRNRRIQTNRARTPKNADAAIIGELLVGTSVERSILIRTGRRIQAMYFQNIMANPTSTGTPEERCAPAICLSQR